MVAISLVFTRRLGSSFGFWCRYRSGHSTDDTVIPGYKLSSSTRMDLAEINTDVAKGIKRSFDTHAFLPVFMR